MFKENEVVMNFIFWLAFLLFAPTISVTLIYNLYDARAAVEGKRKNQWGCICLAVCVVVTIMVIRDMSIGWFVSTKHFALLITKIGISVTLLSLALVGNAKRSQWNERINNTLNGKLGNELKRYLPSTSKCFWVYGDYIEFMIDNSTMQRINFNSLGYNDFPPIYADVVCRWIAKNVLKDYSSYKISRLYVEHESYKGGTMDYVEIERTSTGYKAREMPGDPGHLIKTQETTGYALFHSSMNSNDSKNLSNW